MSITYLLRIAACLLVWSLSKNVFGQDKTPVFTAGEDGYKSFRIPAIIGLPNGDLIAFSEGRVLHAGDYGNVKIVMKRSTDGGHTWHGLQIVAEFDTLQAGNPAPVVDLTDPNYPAGRIFIFYNTGNNHEGEVRKGNGLREVWYKTSADDGYSWSAPVNITSQVHKPKNPSATPAYHFSEDWRSYANTPGHAMQFQKGKFKGRIFVAANHSAGDPQKGFADYAAHGFYTDDHGKSFHLSQTVPLAGSNESTAAPLPNGGLMMNSRNQKGDIRARIVSISSDGGATWDDTYFDRTLVDPVNQGSLLKIGEKDGRYVLAFSNAADPNRRDSLTVRISFDDGKTWPKRYLIDSSPNQEGDFTAYSDLVQVDNDHIGILYERDGYRHIVFSVLKWQ